MTSIFHVVYWSTFAGCILNPSTRFLDVNPVKTADIKYWKCGTPAKHRLYKTLTEQWKFRDYDSFEWFAAVFVLSMLEHDFYESIHGIFQVYSDAYMATQDPLHHDIVIAMLGILTIDSYDATPGRFEYQCDLLGSALWDRGRLDDHELDVLAAEYYYTLAIVPTSGAPQQLQARQRNARAHLVECKLDLGNRAMSAFRSGSADLEQALNRVEAFLDMSHDTFARRSSDILDMKHHQAFLYWSRFMLTRNNPDLNKALQLARHAVQQPNPSIEGLTLLANILQNVYTTRGCAGVFNEAIEALSRLEALEDDHPEHKGCSNHFRSGLYQKKFSLDQKQDDIEMAVDTARKAHVDGDLSLRDENVGMLCTALHVRGKRFDRPADIAEALQLIDEHFQSRMLLVSSEDKNRIQLESLRATLMSYNEETRGEAISLHESIRNRTRSHTIISPVQTWKLGRVYRQADQLGKARECFEEASSKMDIRSHEYVRCLHDLGNTYTDLAGGLESEEEKWGLLKEACTVHVKALFSSSGETFIRAHSGKNASLVFYASSQWRNCYKVSVATIKLFPRMVTHELLMEDAKRLLTGLSDVSSLAASAAIKMSAMPINALRLMENGRGVILKLSMDVKNDHARLKEAHHNAYQQYIKLQEALQDDEHDHSDSDASMDQRLQKSHERTRCVQEMTHLRKEITSLDGFHDFDQPFSNGDMEELACTGNIVVFNSSYSSANPEPLQAFVVKAGRHARVQVIELRDMNLQEAKRMADRLAGPKRLAKAKGGRPRIKANEELRLILETTWTSVVQPILRELDLLSSPPSGTDDLPRVFWITSGVMSMLPLHAAGVYDNKGRSDQNATMYCVSSYAATVQALSMAYKQKQRKKAFSVDPQLLLVAMPKTHGQTDLPDVEEQISRVGEIMCRNVQPCVEPHINPNKSEILSLLPKTKIAHFACHGTSNRKTPSQSGLHLGTPDMPSLLTVRELSSLNLSYASLAYLSACSTAQNVPEDQGIINEVLHVASAFQLAGFPQVVGSLWEMRADFAPEMAACFYRYLRARLDRDGDGEDGARALHAAVQERRGRQQNEFLNWTGLVHFGH